MTPSQRHIIKRQVLEIHVDPGSDVSAMQAEVGRIVREDLLPIIGELCDRMTPQGEHLTIARLDLDLGELSLPELPEVFAGKFADAIQEAASEGPLTVPDPTDTPAATPREDALAFYLKNGILPWWVTARTKAFLEEILEARLAAPDGRFRALLREIGRGKSTRERFIYTFSAVQVRRALEVLTGRALPELGKLAGAMSALVRQHPESFREGLRPEEIGPAFWSAVFGQVALTPEAEEAARRAVVQAFWQLGADFGPLRRQISGTQLAAWLPALGQDRAAQLAAIARELAYLQHHYRANRWLQAFARQFQKALHQPQFAQLPVTQLREVHALLQRLVEQQKGGGPSDATLEKAITQNQLVPVAQYLDRLEGQLRRMTPGIAAALAPDSSAETDFIAVENAGLVLLWPFLLRLFENLDLVAERAFRSEWARHRAASVLQYLVLGAEEVVFEGQMPLNKVLCGISLEEAIAVEPLTEAERERADGMLRAVISRGPHWKNLSVGGLRASYLQREGLLRSRDGHWLLQVKKETYDITLGKLPWSFNVVKLPWMNELLMVEWM
ncbi:MAG: contractile injection system tape measure protein [Bacteroidota bacterium]